MIDLTATECTVSPEELYTNEVTEKEAKYMDLSKTAFLKLYYEARSKQEQGNPWQETTIEAIYNAGVARGFISEE